MRERASRLPSPSPLGSKTPVRSTPRCLLLALHWSSNLPPGCLAAAPPRRPPGIKPVERHDTTSGNSVASVSPLTCQRACLPPPVIPPSHPLPFQPPHTQLANLAGLFSSPPTCLPPAHRHTCSVLPHASAPRLKSAPGHTRSTRTLAGERYRVRSPPVSPVRQHRCLHQR